MAKSNSSLDVKLKIVLSPDMHYHHHPHREGDEFKNSNHPTSEYFMCVVLFLSDFHAHQWINTYDFSDILLAAL